MVPTYLDAILKPIADLLHSVAVLAHENPEAVA
jgi:hypothetical protein